MVERRRLGTSTFASRINIAAAMSDPQLLGAGLGNLTTWSPWMAILRAAFGLELNDRQRGLFPAVAGGRDPPSQRVKELWCVCGRRSGKTRMAAAISVYTASIEQHRLAPGEVGYVLLLAASKAQASVAFQYVVGFLEASPILRGQINVVTQDEVRLRGNIIIGVHSGSYRTIRGRILLAVVGDETSYWRSEDSAQPDVEIFRACAPALAASGGIWVGISTGYKKFGLLHQKWRDHFGQSNDDVLVIQAASEQLNPTLDRAMIARAKAADPEAADSEWGGGFRSDISQFLPDADIEAAINYARPMELPRQRGLHYRAFCDASGGRHDHYVVGISHKEGASLVLDALRGRAPPFDPDAVTKELSDLVKSYGCREITGDNYSAAWTEQAWNKTGVRYRRSEINKSQIYLETLVAFTRNQASLPNHSKLIKELRLLERRVHRSGRDTIDHGPHGSDDYANACCGALYMLGRPGASYLSLMMREDDEPEDATPKPRHPNVAAHEYWKTLLATHGQPVPLRPRADDVS
jgi:hypothetical protein